MGRMDPEAAELETAFAKRLRVSTIPEIRRDLRDLVNRAVEEGARQFLIAVQGDFATDVEVHPLLLRQCRLDTFGYLVPEDVDVSLELHSTTVQKGGRRVMD